MKTDVAWCSLGLSAILAGVVHAQGPPVTVQLPTFSSFSSSTTVSVPDRGSVFLGGVKRAASGRNEFGVPLLPPRPLRNTAIGSERSASGLHVTATIHDFEAMDEFLLSRPTPFRRQAVQSHRAGQPHRAGQQTAASETRRSDSDAGSSWDLPPRRLNVSPQSRVAEIQTQRRNRQTTRAAEAALFFKRGRKAEKEGKPGVAKVYYQMAARRATGKLSTQLAARLDAIAIEKAASQIAQTERSAASP